MYIKTDETRKNALVSELIKLTMNDLKDEETMAENDMDFYRLARVNKVRKAVDAVIEYLG